mmetsp:Transcript_39073/g.63593  ORF Transcript_39073/g.63593 Transcript_39073/m.63593 type:complete len:194 (-) Transcript_39073:47-628(-)
MMLPKQKKLLSHLANNVFCSIGVRKGCEDGYCGQKGVEPWGTVSVYALRDIPRGTIIDENEDNIDTSYPGFAPVKINLGELPESTRSFVLATYHASANVNDTSDHAHEGGHGNNGKHCEERLVRKRKKMKIEKKKAAPSFSLMSSEPEASTVIVLPCYGLAGLIRPLSYVRRTQSGGGGGGGGRVVATAICVC